MSWQVFFSVLMGAMNVGQTAPYVEAFSVARGAAATIFNIVERKSAIDPASQEGEKPGSITGTIGNHRLVHCHHHHLSFINNPLQNKGPSQHSPFLYSFSL